MGTQLWTIIKELQINANSVSNRTEEISKLTEVLATGAEEQTAQLKEIAQAMEQMNQMILDTNHQAISTRENVENANNSVDSGRRSVGVTIDGIENTVNIISQASEMITTLDNRAKEIGQVIQVIDDIADQTNLLALNANIEAARAGEAGRGFAVVADEVRKLAERTVGATREVGQKISNIQEGVASTVDSMGNVSSKSRESQDLANQSGQALDEISSSIENVNGAVNQIAGAVDTQSAGAEEISANMDGIATVASDAATSSNNISNLAENLISNARNLAIKLGEFRVSKYQWTPDLKTGNLLIDAQHIELYQRVGGFLEGDRNNHKRLEDALVFLQDYVVYHFGSEEDMMQEINYPEFESHKAKHKKLVDDFVALHGKYDPTGDNTKLTQEIEHYAMVVVADHIRYTDTKLAAYIANR